MNSLEKLKILTPLQKLPKNVGDFGKLIVAKCFEKLSNVQLISLSGHTVHKSLKSHFDTSLPQFTKVDCSCHNQCDQMSK